MSRPADDDEPSRGFGAFFERASVLIVLGLLAMIGIGSGVYLTFFRPEPVVLAPRVQTIPLPTPTFEPFAPLDATDFLAALPTSDLTYGLRSAEPTVMHPVAAWPTRFAEEWFLTYEDGAGGTMTVQAVQHYTLDTSDEAYEQLLATATAELEALAAAEAAAETAPSPSTAASPGASPSPSSTSVPGLELGVVHAGGAEVGHSFKVVKDVTETIEDPDGGDSTEVTTRVAVVTWQNGTAVFVMTADPSVIDDLFLVYRI